MNATCAPQLLEPTVQSSGSWRRSRSEATSTGRPVTLIHTFLLQLVSTDLRTNLEVILLMIPVEVPLRC